jgi:serine phosphatase RsbU (regulator of sigma subunit)
MFAPRRAAVFGVASSGRVLIPPGSLEARSLLAALCTTIGGIPASQVGWSDAPRELARHVMAPRLVPALATPGLGSLVSVPVHDGARLIALIAIEADPSEGDFTDGDLQVLSALASNAVLVVQRLRASETTDEQRLIARDLDMAGEIQRRFLPRLDQEWGAVRVAAAYHPAYNVGGDFYDVVDGAQGEITAVIGDVAGKGVTAALLMSRISSDFRRLARGGKPPQALLDQLNQATVEHTPEDSFATAVVIRIDEARRSLAVANAGHVRPLVRCASGQVVELCAASGLPLGVLPGQAYPQCEYPLEPGDIVLLMTDGVSEALDRDGDRLGQGGLRKLIANAPANPAAIHQLILAAVEESLGSRAADDLTLLSIEIGR